MSKNPDDVTVRNDLLIAAMKAARAALEPYPVRSFALIVHLDSGSFIGSIGSVKEGDLDAVAIMATNVTEAAKGMEKNIRDGARTLVSWGNAGGQG